MQDKFDLTSLWIGGKSVPALSGETYPINNPYTGLEAARVAKGSSEDTAKALECAEAGFSLWSSKTGNERANILYRGYFAIHEEAHLIERLITDDCGKVVSEARKEVRSTGAFLRYCAEEARRISGELLSSPDPDKRSIVTRQPIGIVAAITASNAPGVLFGRKVASALAAGCSVVLKPAEEAFRSTVLIAQLLEQGGLPPGVLNVVAGDAADIVACLTEDPRVRVISFTGSTSRGKQILARSSTTMKRVVLELGGVAPFIVFDDANIDDAVNGLIAGKFRHGGQICASPQRIFLHNAVIEPFKEKLLSRVSRLKFGDPSDESSDYGPVQNEGIRMRIEEIVADAISKGAEVLFQGHNVHPRTLAPTVLSNITPEMRITKEEVFGPVISIEAFSTDTEVLSRANDTEYGLGAYVYTTSLNRAFHAAEALDVGTVGINDPFPASIEAPFGGIKQSGMGVEGGGYGLEEFLYLKQMSFRLSRQE